MKTHVGTKICEKCGRPLSEEAKAQKIVDMRYDGTAIRSKTYNKSIIDKIWNFFSSVKVGVSLIIITLIACIYWYDFSSRILRSSWQHARRKSTIL